MGDPTLRCGTCHKRHVRAEGGAPSFNTSSTKIKSSSFFKAAGIAALTLSAITYPASAASIAESSLSASSPFNVVASESKQRRTILWSLLPYLKDGDDVTKKKFTIASPANIRLLQDDHDHYNETEEEHAHEYDSVEAATASANVHGAETSNSANENITGKDREPWGAVLGASLLVNVATLSGVIILILPAIYRGVLKYRDIPAASSPAAHGHGRFFDIVIPGFAVGALVATSVFLVLPEALRYIAGEADATGSDHTEHDGHRYLQEDSHADGGSAAAKFGCSVLGGFLLPFIFGIFFHHSDPTNDEGDAQGRKDSVASVNEEEDCETCVDKPDVETGVNVGERIDDPQDIKTSPLMMIQRVEDATPEEKCKCNVCEEEEVNNQIEPEVFVTKNFVNKKLCASILIGDGFHNFADGFFLAAAFRSCSVAVAVSIMLVTLFHEIAQELADFIVLTKYGGLPVCTALVLNFVSGLSVCLGGVIFLATNPTDTATGVILAMAGGVYINIAACETAPRMELTMKGRGDRVLMLFSIILGTIPMGLVLLDHKHCG